MRAQLIDTNTKQLVTDFVLEKSSEKVLHTLNVSSPGWTSAFPFADKVVSKLLSVSESEMKEIL